jgi:Glyoxalase-like domain
MTFMEMCEEVENTNHASGTTPVQLEIGWVCVDSLNPPGLSRWWQQLIGGDLREDDDGDVRLTGGQVPLIFLRVPERKAGKNRVHLDLRVTDYEPAIARAMALGATRADDVYRGPLWQVLRDPEGNEFCIIRPTGDDPH